MTAKNSTLFNGVKTIGILCIVLILFYSLLHDIKFHRLLNILKEIRIFPLVICIVLDAVVIVFKSIKWHYILTPIKRLPVFLFFESIAVGALFSTFLPMRADELVKVAYLKQKGNLSVTHSLGSTVADRLIDILTLLLFWGLALCLLPVGGWFREGWFILFAVCVIGGLVFFIFSSMVKRLVMAVVNRFCQNRIKMQVSQLFEKLDYGIRIFPRGKRFLMALLICMVEWSLSIVVAFILLRYAFNLNVPVSSALFSVVGTYTCFAIPVTPSGIGFLEYFNRYILATFFSVPPEQAVAFALIYRLFLIGPISVWGILLLIFNVTPQNSGQS